MRFFAMLGFLVCVAVSACTNPVTPEVIDQSQVISASITSSTSVSPTNYSFRTDSLPYFAEYVTIGSTTILGFPSPLTTSRIEPVNGYLVPGAINLRLAVAIYEVNGSITANKTYSLTNDFQKTGFEIGFFRPSNSSDENYTIDSTKAFSGTLTVTSFREKTATAPARAEGTFSANATFTGYSSTASRQLSFPAIITNGKFAVTFIK